MPDCPRCGERMSHNDETTKLTEYVCARCHETEIVKKPAYRVTGGPTVTAADDD
jgi:ribosomal protein S27AE